MINICSRSVQTLLVITFSLVHLCQAQRSGQQTDIQPWFSLSWASLHHDLSLDDKDYLKSAWSTWETMHQGLNKYSGLRSYSSKGLLISQQQQDLRFLCDNWASFRLFLELNPQLEVKDVLSRKHLCPKLDHFIEIYQQAKISLLFISASLQSPASAFGHLILSVELPLSNDQVLDRSFAFSFSVPYVSGISHGLQLLFSHDQGYYQVEDLHKVTHYYQTIEDRTIWSYPLSLSLLQKERLLLELWSLIQRSASQTRKIRVEFSRQEQVDGRFVNNKLSYKIDGAESQSTLDKSFTESNSTSKTSISTNSVGLALDLRTRYSFSNSNCASKLSLLLANATRRFDIYEDFDWPHAPQELIQNLERMKLLEPVKLIPSISERLRALQNLQSDLNTQSSNLIKFSQQDYNKLKLKLNDEYQLVKLYHSSQNLTGTENSQIKLGKRQSKLLQRIAKYPIISTSPLGSYLKSIYARGTSPAPENSLSYAQIALGIDSQLKLSLDQEQYAQHLYLRWRGQSFADQSTPYALSQYAWTLGAFEFRYDPNSSLSQGQNQDSKLSSFLSSSSSRWTLFEYKQRALDEQDSWTWNISLAYQDSPQFQLALGHTFANQTLFDRFQLDPKSDLEPCLESQLKSTHHDQSRLFSWASPSSRLNSLGPKFAHSSQGKSNENRQLNWQASFLIGIDYVEDCDLNYCSSPLKLQLMFHGLSNSLSIAQTLILVDWESELAAGIYESYLWLGHHIEPKQNHQSGIVNALSQKQSLKLSMRYLGNHYLFLRPYTINALGSYQSNVAQNESDGIFRFNASLSFNY